MMLPNVTTWMQSSVPTEGITRLVNYLRASGRQGIWGMGMYQQGVNFRGSTKNSLPSSALLWGRAVLELDSSGQSHLIWRFFTHLMEDPGRPWTLLCCHTLLTLTDTDVCRVILNKVFMMYVSVSNTCNFLLTSKCNPWEFVITFKC